MFPAILVIREQGCGIYAILVIMEQGCDMDIAIFFASFHF
jgi:hypothetical protein